MFDEIIKLSRQILRLKDSPYRRYLIRKEPFKHRLSILVGQRGVGKTTTLVQHLLDQTGGDPDDPSILYVQVDHFQVGTTPLYEIAEQFYTSGGKVIAFDEIHKYANWSQELKSLYDTFPKLKILVSGSSALKIHRGSHDLARRAIKYQLFGLSFREYLDLQHQLTFQSYTLEDILQNHEKIGPQILKVCEEHNQRILPLFHRYLKWGYYPYFFELPNEELYSLTLEQNLHTTIEADLGAIYPHLTGSTITKIKKLMIFIANSVPFTPNWNKLKDLLEIGDIRTLKTYFYYLEDAGLTRSVGKNLDRLAKLDGPSKIYLDNPNQMQALSPLLSSPGTLRELFFLNMVSTNHSVTLPHCGDFLVDETNIFEIGGKNKSFEQIKEEKNGYLACDDIELGIRKKIPLWLMGFLY